MNRRHLLSSGLAFITLTGGKMIGLGAGGEKSRNELVRSSFSRSSRRLEDSKPNPQEDEKMMQIGYLEVVTPDVDEICAMYSQMLGAKFSESDPNLGNARTTKLAEGGKLGIRAPMRDTEDPVVRTYWLVDDIEASVAIAEKSGAEIAMPPMELPGNGTFAIFIQGGIEIGLWQNKD